MDFTIFSHQTGEPVYTTEVPDYTPEFACMRVALEKANRANVDLTGADLRGADLSHLVLRGAVLRDAKFTQANLHQAFFRNTDLRGSDFGEADLTCASMRYNDLQEAQFMKARLGEADFAGSSLRGAYFSGADLEGVRFSNVDLRDTLFWGALNMDNLGCLQDVVGDEIHIKSLQLETWNVAYTATHMQIGCQLHPLEDWWQFSDKRIASMDFNALAWWQRWKPILQTIISESPALRVGEYVRSTPLNGEAT